MNNRALTPARLVEGATGGDPIAVDNLIAAVWPHAYRIALAILCDRALAEDAAQESCAVVAQSIGALRRIDSFSSWFYRIVYREALRVIQVEERKPAHSATLAGTREQIVAMLREHREAPLTQPFIAGLQRSAKIQIDDPRFADLLSFNKAVDNSR